jgi:hypothetical protein
VAEALLQLLQFAAWHLVKVPPPLVHEVSAKLHLKASIVVVVEHAFVEMPMLLTHLKQVSPAGKSTGAQLPVEEPTLQLMACAETTSMAASTVIWANFIIVLNGPVAMLVGTLFSREQIVHDLIGSDHHPVQQGGGWKSWVGTESLGASEGGGMTVGEGDSSAAAAMISIKDTSPVA